jgi:hypothetical protein
LEFSQFQQLARALLAGANARIEGADPRGVQAGLQRIAIAGLSAGFAL